jgi:glutathione S-transferase
METTLEPILFYGVPEGSSFGSIVALEWVGRPYRLCRVAMPELVTTDDYKRINPVAETPAFLTEDGLALTESVAILLHLGVRAVDQELAFRQGTADFDGLNRVLCFLNTDFYDSFSPLWYAFESGVEGQEKAALTDFGRKKVRKAHADLDALLGDQPWLLDHRRTLADAYFVGIARWTDFHKVLNRTDYPNLNRLYEKLQQDTAVRFAHAIEEEEPTTGSDAFRGHVSLEEALALMKPSRRTNVGRASSSTA